MLGHELVQSSREGCQTKVAELVRNVAPEELLYLLALNSQDNLKVVVVQNPEDLEEVAEFIRCILREELAEQGCKFRWYEWKISTENTSCLRCRGTRLVAL
jgi:division protein CdvB (Snf7/Vps24/ESCRT-III family)